MHAVLQQARELVPDDHALISVRDAAGDVDRASELLTVDAKSGLDVALARRAEEQALASHEMAVASHRLNRLVALFFPIATFAAVFGMNLRHGLEERHPLWFWSTLVIGIGVGYGCRAAMATRSHSVRGEGREVPER